ncbi:MAG TPA: hypothetical protein VJQ55_12230 [Candidatus Binatia bacterium]|nr:hypothetical protein [Candidatus Binatia bacterium]
MAPPANAQGKNDEPESATFSSRKDNKDGSSSLTFGARLPSTIDTKLGVDLGLASPNDLGADASRLLDKSNDRGTGAGWASMTIPTVPLGFTRAKVEARHDPSQDQGNIGMAVSHPVGEGLLMTLQNGYAVSGFTIPFGPGVSGQNVENGRTVRFDVLSTSTALSAGTRSSTLDDKQLRTFSAEQKVIGPLSITGTISETPTGALDRALRAGFKKTW